MGVQQDLIPKSFLRLRRRSSMRLDRLNLHGISLLYEWILTALRIIQTLISLGEFMISSVLE
jgi:hypothetical protein